MGTRRTKVLIDAGISGRATKNKLEALGVAIEEIQAILISHEHADHIQGLRTLALRWKIPVLANAETAKGIYSALRSCPKFKIFTTGEPFTFGDLTIHPFSVQHDTLDPVAFTLQCDGIKLGVCTDLGYPTTLVKHHLQACNYLVIEANHEPAMVHASSRPALYKERVLGRNGHLSNEACGALLSDVMHDQLKHIYLAHLSQECNSPHHALSRVQACIGHHVPLAIAPQHESAEHVAF